MMKNSIFWNKTPYCLLKDKRRFEGESFARSYEYVPENRIPHKHLCESLKSYNPNDAIMTPFA
jgi:hypothetical protein